MRPLHLKLRLVLIGSVLVGAVSLPAPRLAQAATFTVTTTADSGAGSLRQALLDANATTGLDTITFAIGAAGSQQTILPLSALPTVTDPVLIDGWSQGGAGYAGPPLIEINGSAIVTWNTVEGLTLSGGGSTVRGLALNYFNAGLELQTAGGNVIAGNYIGLALDGVTAVGNRTGLIIQASSDGNRIGTDGDGLNDAAERNVISASGLVQVNNSFGIQIAPGSDNNWVAGNFIGTDAGGTLDRGNQSIGVSTGGVTIIGTNGDGLGDAVEGNLISGNGNHGIQLGTTASGSRVAGNRIGTDVTGAVALPNANHGLSISPCFGGGQCSDHIIGTNGDGVSDSLEGNLISGNGNSGVFIPAGSPANNVIAGNRIGTNAAGDAALPNGDYGVHLGGTASRVGTNGDGVSDELEANVISGNDIDGLYSPGGGTSQHLIAGNYIGTNASGTGALPNGQAGLLLEGHSSTIAGNVIAGNGAYGLHLNNAFTHTVIGNLIGTAADGVTPLGNALHGVYVTNNSDNHTIGGAAAGEGNVIAYNGGDGVFVSNSCGGGFCVSNLVVGNAIYSNAGLGLDLFPDGVNANDQLDADTGANGRQNFPVIGTVEAASSILTATGTLSSGASTTFDLHFYGSPACDPSGNGEGEIYLGVSSATTDAAGLTVFTATLTAAVPDGSRITATATDPDGNTSEFSACSSPTGYAPISGLQAANDSPTFLGGMTRLTATVAAGTGVSYAWDLGDGQMAAGASVSHMFGAIGIYTAVVTATNSGSAASAATVVTILQPPACAATADDGLITFTSEDALAVQQAVDAAPVGGLVKLTGHCAGVTPRNGVVQTAYLDKPLTLRGGYSILDWSQSLPLTRPTVLDGMGLGRVVYITNTVPVTIENLSLQNGVAGGVSATCPTTGCGGGLYSNGALVLNGVTLNDNAAARAGGAYVLGTLQASDTTWQGNQCSQTRGGALEAYSPTTLTGGLFSGNQCNYAGAVFVDAALTVSGTHFISNTATHPSVGSGGAIYANGTLTISHAYFERNTAQTGAGAVLHTGGASDRLNITATTFLSNTAFHASAQGGALYTSVPIANISHSQFEGNSTPGAIGNGGALVVFQAITLTQTSFFSNTAGNDGGALYHWGLSETGNTGQTQPLVLSNTVLSGNQAGGEGGALYFRRGFAAANEPIRLHAATFLSNTAILSGGAAYLGQPGSIADSLFQDNASTSGDGGGLYAEDTLALAGTLLQDNLARRGGGAYAVSTISAVDTTWQDNYCTADRGGALHANGSTTLNRGRFEGNYCAYGGGLFVDASLAISGTRFISNTAISLFSGSGGAIYADGTLTMVNALFERNTAHTGGGAVLHTGAAGDELTISATTFISNTALHTNAQGGALNTLAPIANISHSQFEGNSAPGSLGSGGAIAAFNAITLTKVTLAANSAGNDGGALYHWGLSETDNTDQILPLVLSNTVLTGNHAGSEGGALYFRRGFPAANVPIRLEQATFQSNTASLNGGAVFLGQPAVVNRSSFLMNTSGTTGGGLYIQDSLQLDSVQFHGNAANLGGGLAIAAQAGTTSVVVNSLMAGNYAAANGAGLALIAMGRVDIVHTTIAGTTLSPGQAIYAGGGTVHITNTIVASHTVGLQRQGSGAVTAAHSLFFGNLTDLAGGATLVNPVSGNPSFLDPGAGDYHLALGSAAVDGALNVGLGHDFEADLRHIGALPDIGADEFGDAALIAPGTTTTLTINPRPGQQITLTLPPGTSGGAAWLSPSVTPTRPLPPGKASANVSFWLNFELPSGQAALAAETGDPFTVVIRYRDIDVLGWNEAGLELLWWDEAGQAWQAAQTSCLKSMPPSRQPETNTLVVQACAAGEFVLANGLLNHYLPLIRTP